jgi:hypothetical protein
MGRSPAQGVQPDCGTMTRWSAKRGPREHISSRQPRRSLGARRRLHRFALILVGILVLAALWATVALVSDLIRAKGVATSADQLLAAGPTVWLGNNLAFGLLYWLIDVGGPVARSNHRVSVDLAFTQQLSPEVPPALPWRVSPLSWNLQSLQSQSFL